MCKSILVQVTQFWGCQLWAKNNQPGTASSEAHQVPSKSMEHDSPIISIIHRPVVHVFHGFLGRLESRNLKKQLWKQSRFVQVYAIPAWQSLRTLEFDGMSTTSMTKSDQVPEIPLGTAFFLFHPLESNVSAQSEMGDRPGLKDSWTGHTALLIQENFCERSIDPSIFCHDQLGYQHGKSSWSPQYPQISSVRWRPYRVSMSLTYPKASLHPAHESEQIATRSKGHHWHRDELRKSGTHAASKLASERRKLHDLCEYCLLFRRSSSIFCLCLSAILWWSCNSVPQIKQPVQYMKVYSLPAINSYRT